MTNRLLIILTLLTSMAFGQEGTTTDILEIIRVGLIDKTLPKELINNIDSLQAVLYKENYDPETINYPRTVGIEGSKENGLKYHQHIKWDKKEIWIWGAEDFFAYDAYWLTPTNIKVKSNKISFDFVTHSWRDKNVKYYKGTVKAEKMKGNWTVRVTKLAETKNYFDQWDKMRDKHVIQMK